MSADEIGAVLCSVLIVSVLCIITGKSTQENCDDIWSQQLTKSGHAEFFLDSNNVRQWRMKEAR